MSSPFGWSGCPFASSSKLFGVFAVGALPKKPHCALSAMKRLRVRDVYRRFVRTVAFIQEQENKQLCVGGSKVSCKADEIAFRCVASTQDGQEGLWWLRWICLTRRKSSKIVLAPLPDRFVKNTGTGGGGSLAIVELVEVFRINSNRPVLAPESLLHTDSAKAYKRMGPLRWPEPGVLHNEFECSEPFAQHKYTHTNVTHKKKPWTKSPICRRASGDVSGRFVQNGFG
jgi:hypothetical protein